MGPRQAGPGSEALVYGPWPFFLLFLGSFTFLDFGAAPLETDLFVLFLGVLAPLAVAFAWRPGPSGRARTEPWKKDPFPIPRWLWIVAGLLLIFYAFYRWQRDWPWPDDGVCIYFPLAVAEKNDWRWLYGGQGIDPLFIWMAGLWLKVFPVSWISLKAFSLAVFWGALGAGYMAARRFLSGSNAFLMSWFFAFNGWAFCLVRHSQQYLSLLLMEGLCAWCLGGILGAPGPRKAGRLGWLAVCLGLGFYTYPSWPVVAVMVAAALLFSAAPLFRRDDGRAYGALFLFLILAAPWALARLSPGGTSYFKSLWGAPAGFHYLGALFWNGLGSDASLLSDSGWLNPCFCGLLLVGLLDLWIHRARPWARWIMTAWLLFFLPGALTWHVEIGRIIQVLPLAALLAGLGVRALAESFPGPARRLMVFCALAALSFGFDLYQQWGPGRDGYWEAFSRNQAHWTSFDLRRAYGILAKESAEGKRCWILDDLNNVVQDQTLDVLVFSMDGARQPPAVREKAVQAAVLINANYEAGLRERFPGSRWTWLSPGLPADHGGLELGLIPLDPATRGALERWEAANAALRANNGLIREVFGDPRRWMPPLLSDLEDRYALFQGDPFLESVYWERVAVYREMMGDGTGACGALKTALRRGLPSAQLYDKLGGLEAQAGHVAAAADCFQKALACPIDRTDAAERLGRLRAWTGGQRPDRL